MSADDPTAEQEDRMMRAYAARYFGGPEPEPKPRTPEEEAEEQAVVDYANRHFPRGGRR